MCLCKSTGEPSCFGHFGVYPLQFSGKPARSKSYLDPPWVRIRSHLFAAWNMWIHVNILQIVSIDVGFRYLFTIISLLYPHDIPMKCDQFSLVDRLSMFIQHFVESVPNAVPLLPLSRQALWDSIGAAPVVRWDLEVSEVTGGAPKWGFP